MAREEAISTARAIQALLGEYGVENDALDNFIKEAATMPSSDVADTFNGLVMEYRNAQGYQNVQDAGEELYDFWASNQSQLENKEPEMRRLRKYLDDSIELERYYRQLQAELDE